MVNKVKQSGSSYENKEFYVAFNHGFRRISAGNETQVMRALSSIYITSCNPVEVQ
jgi:hypothetical protein